jgi:protein TonB
MFQELVTPHADSKRKWYTLPLSFLVHTSVLAVLVVIPLVATDSLPMPRASLQFVPPQVMPIEAPPVPARTRVRPEIASAPMRVPVVAPDTISPEPGLIHDRSTIETSSLESIVGGFGTAELVLEAPPPPAIGPAPPVRPGGVIKPPVRTRHVMPEYPDMAKKSRVQGMVVIEAIIGVDGRVDDARVLRGHALLDRAALDAVRSWEYTPTLLNGVPTPVIMTVTVNFTLD